MFIVVCNNTAISKLVFEWISGFEREHDEGNEHASSTATWSCSATTTTTATALPRPHTLLIDSEQLEVRRGAGQGLPRARRRRSSSSSARSSSAPATGAAADNRHRPGPAARGDEHRRPARAGSASKIRCVVSVSMLTEGWDANTVTHILGVRAFGTQLLCEQVVGRGLRRQSYDLNDEGLFNVEYADILGIPFDFTAKPVVAPPRQPRETVRVQAVQPTATRWKSASPASTAIASSCRTSGSTAHFDHDSVLELTPELVGAVHDADSGHRRRSGGPHGRASRATCAAPRILFHLAKHLLYQQFRDPARTRSCICSASSSASHDNGSTAAICAAPAAPPGTAPLPRNRRQGMRAHQRGHHADAAPASSR